ncbi:MAG TPA: hypothetical protein VHM48_09775 [Candidatus Limnocylindrales bacterium]|nr:hypothetical protein [Candidatus Limnocylindrales bacterium]
MTRFLQRAALAVVWLLIVAVVSVGGAGLVAAMANQPATPARAELTADGDAAAVAALDGIQVELSDLTKDVERLGELGRGALTALVSSDFATLDSAVADGQGLARAIEARSGQILGEVRLLSGTGPNEALVWSPETSQRRDLALAAVNATGGLELAWTRFASGSTVANRLTILLTNHDTTAGKAAATGRDRKYAAALKTLATAQAMLDEVKTLRDALANTVDVNTLTQWIDRNAEYDAALARLYKATIAAKGKITNELKSAFAAERKAHDFLPSNTTGLVIILAEIGRGGLNQAVIGIEETRAKLQAAVDRLSAPVTVEPDASDDGIEPSPSGG